MYFLKPGRVVRFFCRYFGIISIREPLLGNSATTKFEPKDMLLAFHWCKSCKAFRYDRHYDPMSKSERLMCAGCTTQKPTLHLAGVTFFAMYEYWRVASLVRSNRVARVIMFFTFCLFGLGKHMPQDRGGKTIGELEYEVLSSFFVTLSLAYNHLGVRLKK